MNPPRKSAMALASFVSSSLLLSQFQLTAQEAPARAAPNVKAAASGQTPPGSPGDAKPVAPGDAKPAAPGQPNAAQKPGEKAAEKAAEPGRPRRKPTQPADPAELQVQPGDDGLVSFSFKGQDWEDVLEWLADISEMSLQMEEVPPGFLNLTSRGRYTVDQVQDLVNSALIGKGYTLLRSNEILHVVKLEKLDKSLVPRVEPRDLDERGTYEFVKCFFDLDSLVAEPTAAELGPMMSPHGKITALKTTNRLDIVETAGNMRRIRDFLADEQSDRGKENVLREFKLRYVRATEVFETLHTVLGLKKAGPQVALTPDQIAQMQQQFMQAAQQAAQAAGKGPSGQQPGREVYLAINKSENSILANAPADKMTIIEQAVKAMDIPKNKSDSLLSNMPKLRSYKISSVDPAALVKVLEDLGNLDPLARLEVDSRSRSIIAYAPPIDHVTIQAIVDKIDGSGRKFEVVQLYVLDAAMVAGSIEFLMRGGDDKSRSNYNPFFFDFGYGSSRSRSNERDPSDQIQVEADTERNRLLLRVTDSEMKEIRQLLTKLGELPEDDRGLQTTRIVPLSPGDVRALIERIRHAWPAVAPNPLQVAPLETPAETPANGTEPEEKSTLETAPVRRTERNDSTRRAIRLASAQQQDPPEDVVPPHIARPRIPQDQHDEPPAANQPRMPRRDDPPPISITPGPNGLVISSQDTEALDQLERIISELMPTQRVNSKIFYLKNSFCKDVADVLKDIFQEGETERKPNPYLDDMYYYYRYGPGSREKSQEKSRLSRRRQLKFVPEPTTNTIMVLGADPSQLIEIARLIEIYDEGVRPDSNSVRVTEQLFFRYTTAREVAEVVKDVFRDLLSPNDKALAKGGQQQQQQQDQAKSLYSYTYVFGNESDRENARKFKGLVSMGIDDRSNTLFVSAPKDLMAIISKIGDDLDRAAGATRGVVRVLDLGGTLDSTQLLRALSGAGRPPVSVNGQADKDSAGEKGQPQPGTNRNAAVPQ